MIAFLSGCGKSTPENRAAPPIASKSPANTAKDEQPREGDEVEAPLTAAPAKAQAEERPASETPPPEIPADEVAASEGDATPKEEPMPLEEAEEPVLIEPVPLPAPENAARLSPTEEVWINRDEKKVYVGGQVALRRGMLEMFACPKGTKEHESVIAVNSLAATVHAALLAAGAVSGTPVTYDPQYKAPTGTEIDITVEWKDPEGNWHTANAREWVRNIRTGKELDVPWVFAGSGFYTDEETGKQHYLAESGDLVCVSNFPSATLDLPVESSQAEAGLLFEAFTERVPALGTPVRLILTPKVETGEPSKE
jgi:hypothetical protein